MAPGSNCDGEYNMSSCVYGACAQLVGKRAKQVIVHLEYS